MATEEKKTSYISILIKAFSILDYMNDEGCECGISNISKATGIPKANVFRIVKTLEHLGIIEIKNEGYVLGRGLLKYAKQSSENNELVDLSGKYLKNLAKEVGETINLGIVYENNVLILSSEFGESTSLVSKLLPICPLYSSSMGKLFLSEQNDDNIKSYFDNVEAEKMTVNTIVTYEDFIKEKEKIQKKGISYDYEEYEYGLTCISSGIRNKNGKMIAAVSLSGPTTRLHFKGLEKLEEKISSLAETISADVCEFLEEDFEV